MNRLIKIFAFCLLAHTAHSQSCDTTGILLELQATTNLQGILFGDDRCLTTATILAPLYISGDTLRLDTTGLGGGGGGGIGLDTLIAIPPAAGFTIAGSPAQNSRDTLTFTLANDLAALEALADTGIIARTATEAYALRKIMAGTGISIANGSGVSGNPTITNTDPDQSITNEGLLGVGAGGATSSVLLSNTSTAAGVTINAAGILAISETTSANGGQITLTATEVGLGTVTSFSAGDLSPLFTTTETNPTTTPALTFTASNGTAKSVFGVTGTAAARADIATSTADQVLRNNGGNTAIGWGTVATGGITDNAVTYAKMQDVAANNVLLGNDNGINSDAQELTPAEVQTMLGYVDGNMGAGGRVVYSSDANTVAAEAAFLYSAANDRMTINCDAPSFGAGAAILNLANVGTDNNGEFLGMRGSITNLLTAVMANSSTAATSGTLLNISQAGNGAGDPYIQTQISGAGGNTTSLGMDNSDANKFKISPNANTVGANVDASLVCTQDVIPLWGINKDAPGHPLDVNGRARATEYLGYSADEPTVGTLGNGLGTGAAINDVIGTNNGFSITFTTGTTPTAGGNMFVVTYSEAYPGFSIPVFSQGNDAAAGELTKFSFAAVGGANFTMKVAAGQTLTASTQYILNYAVNGF